VCAVLYPGTFIRKYKENGLQKCRLNYCVIFIANVQFTKEHAVVQLDEVVYSKPEGRRVPFPKGSLGFFID